MKYELEETIFDIIKTLFISIIVSDLFVLLSTPILDLLNNEISQTFTSIIQKSILLVLYYRIAKDYGISIKESFQKLKIKVKDMIAYSSLGCELISFTFILLLILVFLLTIIIVLFKIPIPKQSYIVKNTSIVWFSFIIMILRICIIAPIFEEIIFRGFIYNIMNKQGEMIAIFFTSLLFAVMHGINWQFLNKFIGSILLINITIHYKNLIPAIIMHSMINFISILYFSSPLSDFSICAIAIINTILVYYFYKKNIYVNLKLHQLWEMIKSGVKSTLSIKVCIILLVLMILYS